MRYTGEEAHVERGMEISVDICFQLKVAIMSHHNGKFTNLYKGDCRSVGKMRTYIRIVQEVAIFVPKLLEKVPKGAGKSLNRAK